MKISTQRAIDRWVGQALCALLSVWSKLLAVVVPNAHHHRNAQPRILVILLSEMGSVVLAKAMFDTLKAKHPGAELHVLQLKKNQGVMRLLGFVPETNLHSLDDSSLGALLHDLWHTTRHLRTLQLDGVLDCELFSRISALLSYACGARVRVGFTSHTQEGLYRGSFINHAIPYNPYQHISKQFLSLVDALEASPPGSMPRNKMAPIRGIPSQPELSVDFSATELQGYRQQLAVLPLFVVQVQLHLLMQ